MQGELFKKTKMIKSIQFGLLDPKEIEKMAVCEINQKRSFEDNGVPTVGGINDLRMGSTEQNFKCKTCHCQNNNNCPGHFGFIRLEKPVFHVGFIDEVLKVLKCVCFYCQRLLIDDYDKYVEITKIKNPKHRQKKIYNLCKNIETCKTRKKKVISGKDYNQDKDPYYKEGCNKKQPIFKRDNLKIAIEYDRDNEKNNGVEDDDNNINKDLTHISPEKVMQLFSKIPLEDCKLLGFDPKYSKPEWMIIKNLAVCPPQIRPSFSDDSSLRSQDDLTYQYNQILICNERLKEVTTDKSTDIIYQSRFDDLQIAVATLMKNDLNFGRANKKSGEPIKAIYDRLKGKEGRVRGNLMGKTVNFCARSVISPDPNLQVDEVGVPLSIAMDLTFPEEVTDLNIDRLKQLVINGPNKYPGAKKIMKPNGRIID